MLSWLEIEDGQGVGPGADMVSSLVFLLLPHGNPRIPPVGSYLPNKRVRGLGELRAADRDRPADG